MTPDTPIMNSFTEEDATPRSNKPSSVDMQFYYERYLPFKQLFQWLSHSPKPTKDFTMREFANSYANGAYQRYISYSSLEEFKKMICSSNPARFEIGAVYLVNPKERKNLPKNVVKPVLKELVFDIDLTDYDDIRTCCEKTEICEKCWKFIKVGSKILESALREDFGFKHMVWVFSGRRGAHCWISDARARCLDETARRAIIDYLDVLSSKQAKIGPKKPLNIRRPYHPHVERSLNFMKNEFVEMILQEQEPWLTTPDMPKDSKAWGQTDELLSFIQDKTLQAELRNKWSNSTGISTSRAKWDDIASIAKKVLKTQAHLNQLNETKKDIIIYYMYPRLDIEVSKQMIHLLKSPFCVHPSTGNICVPFDPSRNISNNKEDDDYGFNPMHAPNVRMIQDEAEEWTGNGEERVLEFEKTSLKPYIEYFSTFVAELIRDELKGVAKRSLEEEGLEF